MSKQTNKLATVEAEYGSAADFINGIMSQIRQVAVRSIEPSHFAGVCISMFQRTPKLLECTVDSVLSGILTGAQTGLELDGPRGHAWLIPFGKVAQFVAGYKGYVHLGYQSERVLKITAAVVRKGDEFDYAKGGSPFIHHKPKGSTGEMTHAYAVCKLKGDDEPLFEVLDAEAIDRRRRRSKAKDDGPWKTDEEAMWKKTAVRALSPWIPSPDVQSLASMEDRFEMGQPSNMAGEPLVDLGDVTPPAAPQRKSDQKKESKAGAQKSKPAARSNGPRTFDLDEQHNLLWIECQTRAKSDEEIAHNILEYMSAYQKDGEVIPGRRELNQISKAAAKVTLERLQKIGDNELDKGMKAVLGKGLSK